MKAYQIDHNGFLFSEVECQKNPLEEGQFLVPGGAVTSVPPEIGENQIAKYENGEWTLLPDYSKKVYFHKVSRIAKLFEIGEAFDENFTDAVPLQNEQYQKLVDNVWEVDEDLKITSLKEKLLLSLKTKFESLTKSYRSVVTVENVQWDSGEKYLSNIDTLISVFSKHGVSLPQWRDANNEFHYLTIEQFTSIRNEIEKDMFQEGVRLYEIKWQKENEIDNLELSEIDSYDVSAGWD